MFDEPDLSAPSSLFSAVPGTSAKLWSKDFAPTAVSPAAEPRRIRTLTCIGHGADVLTGHAHSQVGVAVTVHVGEGDVGTKGFAELGSVLVGGERDGAGGTADAGRAVVELGKAPDQRAGAAADQGRSGGAGGTDQSGTGVGTGAVGHRGRRAELRVRVPELVRIDDSRHGYARAGPP